MIHRASAIAGHREGSRDWIFFVARADRLEREDGTLAALTELGLRAEWGDLYSSLADDRSQSPPSAIVVEAVQDIAAARAALARIRTSERLADTPAIISVAPSMVQYLDGSDGFDDFILCPCAAPELRVRLRCARRRRGRDDGERIDVSSLSIDLGTHEVKAGGRLVRLNRQEFALLRFLAQNAGRVFTRDQLLARVWGAQYPNTRTVDMHVRRLREKLGNACDAVQTVRGVGYKLRPVSMVDGDAAPESSPPVGVSGNGTAS